MAAVTYTSWRTPARLFKPLDVAVGGFAVDAAADESNHLTPEWYGPGSVLGEDALDVYEWLNPAWCNPPYGKGMDKWLDKFIEQAQLGVNIVTLLPAYTGTLWWHEKVVKAGADIIFLVGRVQHERVGEDGYVVVGTQPRHDSALVIYGPTATGRTGWLDWRKNDNSGAHPEGEVLAGDSEQDLHRDEALQLDGGDGEDRGPAA